MDIVCGHCKQTFVYNGYVESIQKAENGVIHIRGECPFCRSWLKWIPYRDSEVIKTIIKAFYKGDLESLIKLRDTTIYDFRDKEIK